MAEKHAFNANACCDGDMLPMHCSRTVICNTDSCTLLYSIPWGLTILVPCCCLLLLLVVCCPSVCLVWRILCSLSSVIVW